MSERQKSAATLRQEREAQELRTGRRSAWTGFAVALLLVTLGCATVEHWYQSDMAEYGYSFKSAGEPEIRVEAEFHGLGRTWSGQGDALQLQVRASTDAHPGLVYVQLWRHETNALGGSESTCLSFWEWRAQKGSRSSVVASFGRGPRGPIRSTDTVELAVREVMP